HERSGLAYQSAIESGDRLIGPAEPGQLARDVDFEGLDIYVARLKFLIALQREQRIAHHIGNACELLLEPDLIWIYCEPALAPFASERHVQRGKVSLGELVMCVQVGRVRRERLHV